jgi:hypothetical protein
MNEMRTISAQVDENKRRHEKNRSGNCERMNKSELLLTILAGEQARGSHVPSEL